jgi:hypothetical protein
MPWVVKECGRRGATGAFSFSFVTEILGQNGWLPPYIGRKGRIASPVIAGRRWRERVPDDRLREAIHRAARGENGLRRRCGSSQ